MKNYFMELFEIEADEYSTKEVLCASLSLAVTLIFVAMPLFV